MGPLNPSTVNSPPHRWSAQLPLISTLGLGLVWLLWTGLFLWLLPHIPPSPVTPMLIHQSISLAVVAWFVWRFGHATTQRPSPRQSTSVWLLLAVLLAVLFWGLDQWLITTVWGLDQAQDMQRWQTANQNYWLLSVIISTVCLAPWLEEWLFRGCLFRGLLPHLPVWLSAVLSAALFALIHWQWPAFISLFAAGLIYAWLTWRSGRLLPAVLAHMTHNALTFGFYSLA